MLLVFQMRVVIESDTKVTIYDKCADFDLKTVLEVSGDTLTLVRVSHLNSFSSGLIIIVLQLQ